MQLSFPTLLQNELKSDVARFPTHVQTCQQPEWVQDTCLTRVVKRSMSLCNSFCSNVANKLHVFVTRFSVPLVPVRFSD